jgi:signal transduction histidine kinase
MEGTMMEGLGREEDTSRAASTLERLVEMQRTENEELRRRLALAEAALQSMEEAMWTMNHDLRSPLATVHITLQALLRGQSAEASAAPLPEWAAKRLERLDRVALNATDMITHFLGVWRAAETSGDHPTGEVDLSALVHEIIELHAARLEIARCPITVSCEGTLRGNWDRLALVQILSNLLDNAIKYAPGRSVDIKLARQGSAVHIEITDHGKGLSPDEQQHVFERFTRGSAAGKGGFGLGLWIVRRAASRLHGTVQVKSAQGAGASFIVDLPV